MAVDELILICEPTQVRHMMQVIEPQFQRDFISLLPKEVSFSIILYYYDTLSFLTMNGLTRFVHLFVNFIIITLTQICFNYVDNEVMHTSYFNCQRLLKV